MIVSDIAEGSIGYVDGMLFIRPPGTPRAVLALASTHHVVIEDDGTVSILPSIEYGRQGEQWYWHGWLHHNNFIPAGEFNARSTSAR